ncbi:MAG TPA: hypothetical protein VN452_03785 [Longilinea sp.]|nr:hypothetical protein [Longilinea sp.]
MSRNHQAFLLDSNGFQQRIQSASLELASGSARILFEEALRVVSELRNDWILSETEGPLMDIRSTSFAGIPHKEAIDKIVDDCTKINPADIGYWFLIILSAFLKKSEGIGQNFDVLE